MKGAITWAGPTTPLSAQRIGHGFTRSRGIWSIHLTVSNSINRAPCYFGRMWNIQKLVTWPGNIHPKKKKKRLGNSRCYVPPTLEDKHSLKVKRVGVVPPEFETESQCIKLHNCIPKKSRSHACKSCIKIPTVWKWIRIVSDSSKSDTEYKQYAPLHNRLSVF